MCGDHHGVAARGGREAIWREDESEWVIFHTDRGSTYTAGGFTRLCRQQGIRQSMGRPGSALDNAVIESWHSTLEFELRAVEHFATKAAARAKVAAWIEDYNTNRRHSACGNWNRLMRSPPPRGPRSWRYSPPGRAMPTTPITARCPG